MDANPFDLAAEFCKLVSVPSLLDYLGVSSQATPAEVADKLKARRKYMQGMQANPKYRAEAIFLIKNFGALAEALADPRVYTEDVARRSESGHLAVLEMTMRGVLSGGTISVEQEQFLRNNARELKIAERSYERLLRRLAMEAGAELPLPPPTPSMVPQAVPYPRVASLAPVATPLAPPDRRDTAPPVRPRTVGPGGAEGLPPRLEVMGDPVRQISANEPGAIHIAVRNRGSGAMPGTVSTNVPWLVAVQSVLEPEAPQQTIEIRLAPGLIGARDDLGLVQIHAGNAGSAVIEVQLARRRSRVWLAALALSVVACGAAAVIGLGLASATTSSLVIHVDPGGTVSIDGEVIGTGTTVRVEHPPTGTVAIAVTGGPNFQPWARSVEIGTGRETTVDAELQLAHPLAEVPAGEAPGCEDAASRRAVGERLPALKRCIGPAGAQGASVTVRVGTEGLAVGMDLHAAGLSSATRRCIERQVAALALSPPPAAPCLVAFEIPRP
jgi:hypothetical protein